MPKTRSALGFAMITPHGDPLGRIGEPDIGGQCVYVRELSEHLARAGHQVRIYTRDRGDGKPPVEEYSPRASVHRIPCGPAGFIPKEDLGPHLEEFAAFVRSDLRGDEIVHSHYWDGGHVAHLLELENPWFHTTHSIGRLKQAAVSDSAAYRFDERIRVETEVYRGCDRVVALTPMERRQIHELYDVPESQITVIPPGVNTKTFAPLADRAGARRDLGWPEDAVVVFTLGRLDERKGFDLFLRAAGAARAMSPTSNVLFVMSAGDGSEQERTERRKLELIIEEQSLDETLSWLPVLPEKKLPRYYGAADVFVLPSRYEPFGIVMLEAMSCELPVVATHIGGPATVIEPGRTGLLVDPTDTDAFAKAIVTLIDSRERRHAFGKRARLAAMRDFSWTAIADRHISAYEEVLKEKHHAR